MGTIRELVLVRTGWTGSYDTLCVAQLRICNASTTNNAARTLFERNERHEHARTVYGQCAAGRFVANIILIEKGALAAKSTVWSHKTSI